MPEESLCWLSIAILLTWLGCGLLALAQERHFGFFYPSLRPFDQFIRAQAAIGLIAVCFALPACIAAQGAGFGSVLWILLTTASAMAVAMQLTWTPGALKPLAWLVKRLLSDFFSTNVPR